MTEAHLIATTRMIGEPEDELATVVCACGWESPRTWSCADDISTAFAEHLQTLATALEHGRPGDFRVTLPSAPCTTPRRRSLGRAQPPGR